MEGYRKVLGHIYSPKEYYNRVKRFLKDYKPIKGSTYRLQPLYIKALIKSIFILGIAGKERWYYWRLFFWSLFTRPRLFPLAITFSIYGFHFRKIFEQHVAGL